MLKMLDPMMLPTAMSALSLNAATIDVASSGREVPTETIVRPITNSEIPIVLAINRADSRIAKAPTISPRCSNGDKSKILQLCVRF